MLVLAVPQVLSAVLDIDDSPDLQRLRIELVLNTISQRVARLVYRQEAGDEMYLFFALRMLLRLTVRHRFVFDFMVANQEEWSRWLQVYKEEVRLRQDRYPYTSTLGLGGGGGRQGRSWLM